MRRGAAPPRGWLGAVPALLLALALFPAGSRAALHPLSGVNHNATSQTSILDLTFSVDWNLDSAPTGTWNRSTYRNMIKSFATSIFAMTEGRHRVGKVYTFMNKRSWDKVDIRFVANRTGHSAADPADFRGGSGAVNLYLVFSDGSREGYVGPVLAHESGHYQPSCREGRFLLVEGERRARSS